jgi:hypothetical protein
MLKPHFTALAGAAAMALLAAGPTLAQTAAAPGPLPATERLDPDAEAALNRMGAALRGMQSFEVRSDATTETVYDDKHKIMSRAVTTYTVQRPDRMTVDMQTDTTHRRIYYNGKVMTIVGMKIGKYVTFPVTGTINEVLGKAYDQFGIDFPLQDLFRWGDPSSTVVRPTSGFRVGSSTIDGTTVSQYAFRQPGVDFQIWLEDGVQALPRKMVITNVESPAQPQYVATFTWNRTPTLSGDSFSFTPRPGDKLVDFGTAKAASAVK